jgi:hypothetical protein
MVIIFYDPIRKMTEILMEKLVIDKISKINSTYYVNYRSLEKEILWKCKSHPIIDSFTS